MLGVGGSMFAALMFFSLLARRRSRRSSRLGRRLSPVGALALSKDRRAGLPAQHLRRRGGNEGADASHFLYQLADDRNVTLEVQGPGVLYFARYNHWHGSPWHYEVDGHDYLVQETSTANPISPPPTPSSSQQEPFPNPLTWTWSVTKGADLMWVPIAFESSFRMAYSRTHYGTGYYIYHQFVPGAKLSHPIRAWNEKTIPEKDVRELISRAGTDLLPARTRRRGED